MLIPAPLPTRSIQPEPVRQQQVPSLAFPSIWWNDGPPPFGMVDPARFPERSDQGRRRDRRNSVGATAFISALQTARSLRIVDPKFDAPDGAEPLERALSRSSILNVRLLTGSCPGAVQWCIRVRRQLGHRGGRVAPDVEWKTSLAVAPVLNVHDRFAIVDDELWHFGATVGGAHRSVNAFSRGWDASTTRAAEFFDEAWHHA